MTKEQLGVSRRNFLKASGLTAMGAFAAAGLTGCGQPKTTSKETEPAASTGPAFLQAPEPIVDFSETKEYDVVVVGAGESGLSAVHTALENGATVACVQNVNTAQTTGNMGAYLDIDANDEAALQACVSFINWKSDYRSDRHLVEAWARNSQEALTWWAEEAAAAGVEPVRHDAVLPPTTATKSPCMPIPTSTLRATTVQRRSLSPTPSPRQARSSSATPPAFSSAKKTRL